MGCRGESSITSFDSKLVAVGPLKRDCVPKPEGQHLIVPGIIAAEWCVAFSRKSPSWKGCRIFHSGFLIHFCQFMSSVNRKDPWLLTVHALFRLWLSSFSLFLAGTRSAGSVCVVLLPSGSASPGQQSWETLFQRKDMWVLQGAALWGAVW